MSISIMISSPGSWIDLMKMVEPNTAPHDVHALVSVMVNDNQCNEHANLKGMAITEVKGLHNWNRFSVTLKALLGRCIRDVNELAHTKARIRGSFLFRTHQPKDNDLVLYEATVGALARGDAVVAAAAGLSHQIT